MSDVAVSTLASRDTCVRALVAHSRASDEIPSEGTQGPTGIGEYVVLCAGAGHPASILCTESKEVLSSVKANGLGSVGT